MSEASAACSSGARPTSTLTRLLRWLGLPFVVVLVSLIRLYQQALSPLLPQACRFWPSCSEYAARALRKHGLGRGLAKSMWRLARCHPLCEGGCDEP